MRDPKTRARGLGLEWQILMSFSVDLPKKTFLFHFTDIYNLRNNTFFNPCSFYEKMLHKLPGGNWEHVYHYIMIHVLVHPTFNSIKCMQHNIHWSIYTWRIIIISTCISIGAYHQHRGYLEGQLMSLPRSAADERYGLRSEKS